MRVPMDTAQQTLLEQRPALARLARSLIGDEAEDVLQEAWIAAGDGRSIDRPAGWLRTVIRRTAGKRHRSRIRRIDRRRLLR